MESTNLSVLNSEVYASVSVVPPLPGAEIPYAAQSCEPYMVMAYTPEQSWDSMTDDAQFDEIEASLSEDLNRPSLAEFDALDALDLTEGLDADGEPLATLVGQISTN